MLEVKVILDRFKKGFCKRKAKQSIDIDEGDKFTDYGVFGNYSFNYLISHSEIYRDGEISGNGCDFRVRNLYVYLPEWMRHREKQIRLELDKISSKKIDGLTVGEVASHIDNLNNLRKNVYMSDRLKSDLKGYMDTRELSVIVVRGKRNVS